MKAIFAVIVGVALSFVLSIFGEYLVMRFMGNRPLELGILCPLIALATGATVGLIIKDKVCILALVSLLPWVVWLLLTVNAGHSSALRWTLTIIGGSIFLMLGVGAAAFVRNRLVRSVPGGSASHV
jgi:hypothetical protein